MSQVRGVRAVRDLLELRVVAPSLRVGAELAESTLCLTGRVPDDASRASLLGAAEQAVRDGTVVDELEVAEGAAGTGLDLVTTAVSNLRYFDAARLELADGVLRFDGELAGEESANRVRSSLDRLLPDGYELRADFQFPEAVDLTTCQEMLTAAMTESRILFATSSAEISSDSFGLLDRLAATAQRCPSARIEVSGHTDARGDAEMNRDLSEARAGSVRDYLATRGVTADRLVARGYGEERPVASNDTPAGRAQNRRIEFTIQ